jgi:three-Cys-motif partner protein
MGIKMNIHQYTPDADEQSALTKFLGNDRWKQIPRQDARNFFRGVLDIYKQQLRDLGYAYAGGEILISNQQGCPLYLLLFASKHERGKEFWEKSLKGLPQQEFDFGR